MELESLLPVGMVTLALVIGWVVAGSVIHSNTAVELVASMRRRGARTARSLR
jgi:hypothetical protein